MDSLLYLGAGEDESDDDDDEQESEAGEAEEAASSAGAATSASAAAAAAVVDYAALERAGLRVATDLRTTETYKRLGEAEEEEREAKKRQEEQADEDKAVREAAAAAEAERLNPKKIDERLGWKKRFDDTGEGFRQKEKRKRMNGQQARDSNYVVRSCAATRARPALSARAHMASSHFLGLCVAGGGEAETEARHDEL